MQELERVMHRALRDESYRDLLRSAPELALAEYDLTADERAMIQGRASDVPASEPAE